MNSIITFYSYKGGVGRSMALANIAYELSKRKFKVLVVDWDLEAPGIERYFSSFKIENSSEGLIQLLSAFKNNIKPNYRDYLWKIETLNEDSISLLHSGREKDPAKYSSLLQDFDWSDFFSNKEGGQHLENLRISWRKDFDFVLIDSRTGLSDSSGICTIMMPDILIPMFTANYQSLFGVRDIVSYIQTARQNLNVDRMALTVLPIPSRFGTRVEFKESKEWLERIADILKDCYSDWLPKWIEPKYILEQIKIPQIDYFSFGEKLAVVEQGTNDPEGMGFIFSKIATLLSTDFSDIENFVGRDYYLSKKKEFEISNLKNDEQFETEYLYDVYLSYPREIYQWVKELLIPALTEYLTDELGYKPRLYFDINEINQYDFISLSIEAVIKRSKTYVLIITDSVGESPFFNFELNSILHREKSLESNLLFPITYINSSSKISSLIPISLQSKNYLDLSNFKLEETLRSTKLRSQFGQKVEQLADAIAKTINLKELKKKDKSSSNKAIEFNENLEDLLLLSNEYEAVRRKLPRGSSRTKILESILSKMKALMNDSMGEVAKLINSKSSGERLLAIAYLQEFPNLDYVNILAKHVGASEKPFIGYHASVALYIASRTFGNNNKKNLEVALLEASANIENHEFQDPNQVNVITAALNELRIK